jgi:hypothetical protein
MGNPAAPNPPSNFGWRPHEDATAPSALRAHRNQQASGPRWLLVFLLVATAVLIAISVVVLRGGRIRLGLGDAPSATLSAHPRTPAPPSGGSSSSSSPQAPH